MENPFGRNPASFGVQVSNQPIRQAVGMLSLLSVNWHGSTFGIPKPGGQAEGV